MDVKRRSRELPVDVKEKCSKIVVFCLAKSFTGKLETSEFHDSMIFFTFFNDFCSCSYSCYDPITEKTAEQVPRNARTPHCIMFTSYKTQKQEWMLREGGEGISPYIQWLVSCIKSILWPPIDFTGFNTVFQLMTSQYFFNETKLNLLHQK